VGELAANAVMYRQLVGARIRADWQYRTSFALLLTSQALVAALDFVSITFIFGRIDVLAGWSYMEVALLYGVSGVSFGLADLLLSQVERVAFHIKQGSFDAFLIRPVSPLLQIAAGDFALRRVGRIVQPAVVLVIALRATGVAGSAAHVLLLASTVIAGTVIYSSIWVVTCSIAFWTVETQELANAFTYGGSTMTQYPIDVLGAWLKRLVVFVVPLASIAYLPCAWLLGKPLPYGLPDAAAFSSPLVAAATVSVAGVVWRTAIRHYRSTGS
jgi:ABC-2 type transport system permease protein